MGAIPAWVAPSKRQVHDLFWLAWRAVADTGAPHAGGVECVMEWVSGQRPTAPMTGRAEQPVTRRAAQTEFYIAGLVGAVSTEEVQAFAAEELGLTDWAPEPWHPVWAEAVYQTLRWLLGMQRDQPPMELPARRADGSTPSAEDLYAAAMREQPWLFDLPERRAEWRLRTEKDADRYRRLAAMIDDTKREQRLYTLR